MTRTKKILVENVSVIRADTRALDSVSCELIPGEILALIGPNGSGKSTLIDCLSGFLSAESGTMYIGESKVDLRKAFSPHEYSICRTFQMPRIAKYMTVFDQLLLAARSAPDDTQNASRRVLEVLKLLDASDYAQNMGEALSYGQQKIIEVARVLLAKPRLAFFDEPLAGLAPQAREKVIKGIRKVAEDGAAVVIVEHDFPSVSELAHSAYVLEEGKVFMSGNVQDIAHNPLFHNLYLGI